MCRFSDKDGELTNIENYKLTCSRICILGLQYIEEVFFQSITNNLYLSADVLRKNMIC